MKLSEKEIENVSKLEPIKRYQYFIKRIADHTFIFTLRNQDGSWAISSVENNKLFPIWPAAEYAQKCAIDEWENFSVERLSLNRFRTELMNSIREEKFLLNIFPVSKTTGFVVDLEEFQRDLQEELEKYE